MPGRTRPIEKFAESVAKCSPEVREHMARYRELATDKMQGAVYGKCIASNYQNVSKDMCAKEFMALKDCYLVRDEQCHLAPSSLLTMVQRAAGKKA